jgi:tetratricopeptide (TPR) repeat protein
MLTSRSGAVAPLASGVASSSGAATAWVLTCVCVALFALASACSGGNPNVSAAEDALEAGNYEQALASVEEALAQDSANANAYVLRSRIYLERAEATTDPEQHIAYMEAAAEAQDEATRLGAGGKVEGLRSVYAQREFNAGAEAFNQAVETAEPSDFLLAAARFKGATLMQPDNAESHLNQAYAYLNAGETQKAIPPLEEYRARADTVSVSAYTRLGELYLSEGRNEEAVEVVEEGLDLYPDDEDLQTVSLAAYNEAGMTERVLSVYAERVKQDPDNATYRYNYGSILLSADRYEEAAEQLRAAVEIDPDDARSQYNLGAVYVNQAIEKDERLRALDDSLRTNRDELSSAQQEAMNEEIAELQEERQDLFARAIEPLERAEELTTEPESRQRICNALFQSYMQVQAIDKAEEVEECAGVE